MGRKSRTLGIRACPLWACVPLVFCVSASAAEPTLDWAATYSGRKTSSVSDDCPGPRYVGWDVPRTRCFSAVDAQANIFTVVTSAGADTAVVVVKFRPGGTVGWSREFRADHGIALALDPEGNPIALIHPNRLVKFGATDGNVLWDVASSQNTGVTLRVTASGDVLVMAKDAAGIAVASRHRGTDGSMVWQTVSTVSAVAIAPNSGDDLIVGGVGRNAVDGHNEFRACKFRGSDGVPMWSTAYSLGFGEDVLRALTVDAQGDVILVGQGVINLGSRYEMLTVKLRGTDGAYLWHARQSGHDANWRAFCVATDSSGNVFAGGTEERPAQGRRLVVGKYAAATGAKLWAGLPDAVSSYGGTANDYHEAWGLAVDAADNVVACGTSINSGVTQSHCVAIKFAGADGSRMWTNPADGMYRFSIFGLHDYSHHVFALPGGSFALVGRVETVAAGGQVAVARLASDGSVIEETVWNRIVNTDNDRVGAGLSKPPRAMAVDPQGNTYVAGDTAGKILLVKYNNAGAQVWEAGYATAGAGYGVAVGPDGHPVLAGAVGSELLAIKYDKADGTPLWTRRLEILDGSAAGVIAAIDGAGDVFIAGSGSAPGLGACSVLIKLTGGGGVPVWTGTLDGSVRLPITFVDMILDAAGSIFMVGTGAVYKVRNSDGFALWNAAFAAAGAAIDPNGDVFLVDANLRVGKRRGTDGADLWSHLVGSATVALASSQTNARVAVGPDGNPVVAGVARNAGNYPLFLACKFRGTDAAPLWTNQTGSVARWTAPAQSPSGESIRGLSIDAGNDVHLAGCLPFSGTRLDFTLVKFKGANGDPAWTGPGNGALVHHGSLTDADDLVRGLSVDNFGRIRVVGNIANLSTGSDIVLLKYSGALPPQISVTFLSSPVTAGSTTRLRFDISNPNVEGELAGVTFETLLPAALEIAAVPDALNELGGTLTAAPGMQQIRLVGGTLAAGQSKSVEVDLLAKTAGTHRCTTGPAGADDGGFGSGAFDDVEIVAGPAAAFQLSALPPFVENGTALDIELTVKDAWGNVATNYTGAVGFRSSDELATLPAEHTFAAGDAGRRTFSVTLRTLGERTVTAEAVGNPGLSDTKSTTVVTATAVQLSVTFLTSPTAAGSNTRLRFDLSNPNGIALTGVAVETALPSAMEIAATPAVLNQLGGTLTAVAGGSLIRLTGGSLPAGSTKTIEVDLLARTAGVHRCTTGRPGSNETGLGAAAFDDLVVVAGPAAMLDIAGFPSPVNAGAAGGFEVQVFDAFGNRAANFTGAVKFLSSDPAATLPENYTFVAGDAGRHTFQAVLRTGGTRSLTVELVADAGITDTQTGIEVIVHPPQIAVTFLASPVSSGSNTRIRFDLTNPNPGLALTGVGFENPIPAALQVAGVPDVLNELGGTLTAASGGSTITLVGGSLPAGATRSVEVDLLAKIKGTHVNTVGPASAAGVGAGSGASDDITIVPGAAALFELVGFPESIAAGTAGGFEVKVFDAHGNLATGFTGTVRFTGSDPAATLPANHTFTVGDAGRRSFVATLRTFGVHSLGVEPVPGPAVEVAPTADSQTGIIVGDVNNRITAAASRRTHAGIGRAIPLALGVEPDTATVEPRVGGATQVVLTFGRAMKAVKGVKPGSGHVAVENASLVSADWNDAKTQLTLNLTAADSAWIRITLDPTKFVQGGSMLWGSTQVCVRVLTGDADGDGVVDAADVALVRAFKGKAATAANFRCDINRNGTITETDAQWVLAALGRTAP